MSPAAESNPGPTEASSEETPTKPRRKRRLFLKLALVSMVLLGICVIALPYVASPVAEGIVEQSLNDALGAEGEIDGLKVRYFGGVEVGPGRFERPDESLSIRWQSIESDVTVSAALPRDRQYVGDELTITGLRLRVRTDAEKETTPTDDEGPAPTAASESPAEQAEPFALRLPRIRLIDAEIVLFTDDEEIRFEQLELDSGAPVAISLFSALTGGTGFEEEISATLSTLVAREKGTDSLGGKLSVKLTTAPASDRNRVRAGLSFGLENFDFTQTTPATEDSEARTIAVAGAKLQLQLDAADFLPTELGADETAPLPINHGLALGAFGGDFTGAVEAIDFGDTTVRELEFHGGLRDEQLGLTIDNSVVNEGPVTGQATLTDSGWTLGLDANDIVSSHEVVQLLSYVSPLFAIARQSPAQLACRIGFGMELTGELTRAEPLETISGKGDLRTSSAAIEIPEELRPLLALLHESDRKHLQFEAFSQPFSIRGGRVLNDGFELASKESSTLIKGYTTLTGELQHELDLTRGVERALGNKADSKDWARVKSFVGSDPIRLEGTVKNPRFVLPPVLQQENLIKGAFETGLDLLNQEIKRKSGKDQDQTPGTPEDAAGDALNELINQGLDSLFKKKKKRDN